MKTLKLIFRVTVHKLNAGNSCVWKRVIDGNYACLIENLSKPPI
jgi:hypothetical protein